MSIWLKRTPITKSPAQFVWEVSKPHWKAATAASISVIIASVLYAYIPYIFKLIVDATTKLAAGGSYDDLVWAAIAYIAVTTTAGIVWRMSGFSGAAWATGVRATARDTLTSYVTRHSRSYFSNHFAGSLSNKISHAGNGSRNLVEQVLWQFLLFLVSVTTSFYLAFITNSLIAYLFLAWVIVIIPFNVYLAKKRVPHSMAAHKIETKLSGATVDLLSNAAAMQEYARRGFEVLRLQELTLLRRVMGLRDWWYGETTLLVNGLLQAAFASMMVFVSIHLARVGEISAGDVILVLAVIFNIEEKLIFIGSQLNGFSETWGEIKESLSEILEPIEIEDVADAERLEVAHGEIVFEDISFGYITPPLFTNLTLRIAPGQRVGLVGKSGSGKSTLMRLLLRHHELEGGRLLIDDTDIAYVTQESLRANVSVVPQEPVLFHRTIRENILYGNLEATDMQVVEAAKLAHAHEFIERLQGGYEAMVGERGVKLSGGERQRVVIARAILKNAPILLLDEATSALDSESEVVIQEALHKLMEGKTVIAIAHRLSTLREMDRIIVLQGGKIVEDGTHDELVKHGGVYAELWSHQAGGFIKDE